METRANYLMVGAFVLALVAGALVFVVWLAEFQFERELARYDIHYRGSITGLQEGSPVRFRGVRVGEVVEIGIDPEDPEQVRITVEVDRSTPIRADTVATLEIEGLTGGLYVLLSGASAEAPPLVAEAGQPRPVIPSQSSSLQQVLEGAPELVQKVNLLLTQANDLINAENRAHFANALAQVDDLTGALAGRTDEIDALLKDASLTMKNLREASGTLETMAGKLSEDSGRLVERADSALASIDTMAETVGTSVGATATDARALLADLSDTANRLGAAAGQLEAMLSENREPVRDFTSSGLSELTGLLIELRDLVVALNRVTTEVQRDPARFFFGNQQQGYEPR
ncbi:MAG TPA: MlaD family protein [Kiloniellales bacterium]|nr:MlaD family protein [Kiloniellales bacterium]